MKRAIIFATLLLVAVTGCTEKRVDPATLYNKKAQLPNNLPYDPLQWRVITSGASRQDQTMSTLYGNDAAVNYARANAQHVYPNGAVLALVTWAWQEDPHWYGAQIPAEIKSIEFVQVQPAPDAERQARRIRTTPAARWPRRPMPTRPRKAPALPTSPACAQR